MVLGDAAEIAAVHGVEALGIDLQPGEGGIDHGAVGEFAGDQGEVANAAQQAAGDSRRAAGAFGDFQRALIGEREAEFHRAAADDAEEFLRCVEDEAERDAETVAQGLRQKAGAGGGADQGEGGQVDAHGARGRALADDEVELEILHRRVEGFLDGGLQAVDFVDEEHVARLQIGENGREVTGALEHGAGGGAEAYTHFAGDDLGEGGFAQAGGAVEEDMVQRLAARAGGLDEDGEVFAQRALAGEIGQGLRA